VCDVDLQSGLPEHVLRNKTSPYLDHLSILPTDVVKIQLLPFTKAVSDQWSSSRCHDPNILNAKRNIGSLNHNAAKEAFCR